MSITYSFTDNVSYGTEDINAIVKDLTGAGVAPFPTQDTYSTSDLNALTEAIVSSGVSLDGCVCKKTNNVVTVAQGIIFFENGVRMSIDSDGYELVVSENTAGYVYAYFNASLQKGGIEFSAELPETDYYVLLAKISAGGAVTDMRTFARSKVASFGRNAVFETEFKRIVNPIVESKVETKYTLIIKRLENVDISKFNYALISFNDYHYGVFDLKKGKFMVKYDVNRTIYSDTNLFLPPGICTVEIHMQDNTLVAKQIGNNIYWDEHAKATINVTLI